MSAPTKRVPGMPPAAGEFAAAVAYIVVFPSFIIYHVLVQGGTLPPFLGGYGTASAVLAAPFAGYAFLAQLRARGFAPTMLEALFLLHLALFASVVFLGTQWGADPNITRPHVAFLFKFVVWLLVARSVNGEAPRFRQLAKLLFAAVIVTVLGFAVMRRSLAVVLLPIDPGGTPGDYQASAMIFVIMAAFAIPSMRRSLRYPAYALAFATLFFVGARSEFVAFVLLAIVIEWAKARSRPLFTVAVATAGIAAILLVRGIEASFTDNRIFGLLRLAADESAIMRADMIADGLRTIRESPVFGAYASYIPGEYAHNILSAWVDLGIVGFFIVGGLVAIPLAGLAVRFASDSRRDDFIRSLGIASVVALLMLAAKHHTYQLIPVSVGLYARYRIDRRTRLLAAAASPAATP